jgi:hypothetical protein
MTPGDEANVLRCTLRSVPIDYRTQLACADAFRRLAQPLIPGIRSLPEGAGADPDEGIGDLAACAANMAFALELYLKLMIALPGGQVPHTHDLRRLYDALPDWMRMKVVERYREKGPFRVITLATGLGDSPEWLDSKSADLPSVLSRSGDAFDAWRYMFEIEVLPAGEYQYRRFEYGSLDCACQAIRDTISEVIGEP